MLTLLTKSFAVPSQAAAPVQYGHLAMQFDGVELPLRVLASRGAFYLGTADNEGPLSRESAEYWPTQAAAEQALATGAWTQRTQP